MKKRHHFWKALVLLAVLALSSLTLASCGECEHEWGEWTVSTAPTCTAAGVRTRTCTLCEEVATEGVAALGHRFVEYNPNGDADCQHNETQTASCIRNCGTKDTREIADSKNPQVHAGSEFFYQKNGTDGEKHDKIYTCCNAIAETVAHTWDQGTPDPDHAGVTVYTCADCKITKKEGSPVTGHTHSAVKISANDETCTAFGNIEYWYCAGCDTCFSDATLVTEITEESTRISPAHTGGTATCNSLAVCTHCQTPYGDTDPQNHASSLINAYRINPTDETKHDRIHPCCNAVIETSTHTWDDGTIEGTVTVYDCIFCVAQKSVPVAGHTHSATKISAKSASCTTEGNIEYWYCASCETCFSDATLATEITKTSTKLAPAHTSTEFTYAVNATDPSKHDKKYACCGTVAETVAHAYERTASYAATCETNGYHLYTCLCKATQTVYTSPATGHSVDAWNLVSETQKTGADCTYLQSYEGICFVCREEISRETEIVRHHYLATVVTHATCKSAGLKSYQCACGAKPTPATVEIPVNSNAHDWDDGTTANGITTYTCQTEGCGKTKTAVVYTDPSKEVDKSVLADNEIVLGGISLKLNETTLGQLSDSPVTVSANPVTGDTRAELIAKLPAALSGQITDTTAIYDFALVQNGTDVNFGEGGKITIILPYTLPAGADADCVAIWYVKADKTLDFYEAIYSDGYVTFEATHFSTYLPGVAPSANACVLYGHHYTTRVVAPTCEERGYTEYHCQRCGTSKIDDILYALGHAYDEGVTVASTCTEQGSRTLTCTRTNCGYVNVVTLPLAGHTWVYNTQESVATTCTTDGLDVYDCSAAGCNATKREEGYKAWGHNDMRVESVELASGVTSCADGLVYTMKCYASDGCTYTEQKTVLGEHVNPYELKYDYDARPAQKIMLGTYLQNAGISYTDEPYVEIAQGCLCGAYKGRVGFFGGTDQSGSELFQSSVVDFSSTSIYAQTVTVSTSPQMGWTPETGTYEIPGFTVYFESSIVTDVCTNTYSVTVKIGYDATTQTALDTQTFILSVYESHSTVSSATIDDPSKSCYESCFDENRNIIYGIHVTETCKTCQNVIRTYDTSVSSSSSHLFFLKETYEHNGFKVYIRECPCGQIRCDDASYSSNQYEKYWAGVRRVEEGDYTFTSVETTITNGKVTVYTGVLGEETFRYAIEILDINDTANCRHIYTENLYLDCDAENYKTCQKTVSCTTIDEEKHHNVSTVTTKDNPTPTEYPCYYYWTETRTCNDCGETTYSSKTYEIIHDFVEANVTDSKGNVTTTNTCQTEGCGYFKIETKDVDGNVTRKYIEEIDLETNERCIRIEMYVKFGSEMKPTLERNERYDVETGVCTSWSEYSYRYESNSEKGCIRVETISNSSGNYSVTEHSICEFGNYESQIRTCVQDGYSRETCSNCNYVQYSYVDECQGHSYESSWLYLPDGSSVEYHSCTYCCNAYTTYQSYGAPMDVMIYETGDTVKVQYINRNNPDHDGIDGEVGFVVFAFDESGNLAFDFEPIALENITVTDDGESMLTFTLADIQAALNAAELSDEYQYAVYFVAADTDNTVTYIKII